MSSVSTSLRPASPASRLLALAVPRLRRGSDPDSLSGVRISLGVLAVVADRAASVVDVRAR